MTLFVTCCAVWQYLYVAEDMRYEAFPNAWQRVGPYGGNIPPSF